MATTFKTFLNNDVISSRTLLNEAIPLTGTIVSGTYGTNNIKNYAHGMFQSVFDYPYLSSSANHIFDITAGYSSTSTLTGSDNKFQQSKKQNIYNQMAQILMGYDTNGDIRHFDEDGDLTGGTKLNECIFINFARLLTKDEIKKGSFALELGIDSPVATPMIERIKLTDIDAANEYRINSPAGEYGILIADTTLQGASATDRLANDDGTLAAGQKAGLLFYQAGIAVLTSSIFQSAGEGGMLVAPNATATIAWASTCSPGDTITLTSADGTEVVYTAHDDTTGGSGAAVTFDRVTANRGAEGFLAAIALSSHAGKITGVVGTNSIVLTQVVRGLTGNTAILNAAASVTINGGDADADGAFTGGEGAGETSVLIAGSNNKIDEIMVSSSIETVADALRRRIYNIQFNNTTELNSTIYFCRVNNNDFNYSSNPTYLSGSKIVVKDTSADEPVSYITTIGMYSADNELLAVAKLSEPLKKTPSNEFTLRVRLDY